LYAGQLGPARRELAIVASGLPCITAPVAALAIAFVAGR